MSHFEEKVDDEHLLSPQSKYTPLSPMPMETEAAAVARVPTIEHCSMPRADRQQCLDAARAIAWVLLRELTVRGTPPYVMPSTQTQSQSRARVEAVLASMDEGVDEMEESKGTPAEMLVNANFHLPRGHPYTATSLSRTRAPSARGRVLSARVRRNIESMLPPAPVSHVGTVPGVPAADVEKEEEGWWGQQGDQH